MIALIVILVIGLCLCAGFGISRWWEASNSVKKPKTATVGAIVDFKFITTGLGAPFGAAASPSPPSRQASPSNGGTGFTIQQTTTNPRAYCLLTGTTVHHCTCAEHRSVN